MQTEILCFSILELMKQYFGLGSYDAAYNISVRALAMELGAKHLNHHEYINHMQC